MSATEAREFIKRAATLRSEGRVDEAILAARRATALAPQTANAWWQLALATQKKEGNEACAPLLLKVVELAPSFAPGWHELGRVHHDAGRMDLAIQAYECALLADPESYRSMRMLAFALKDSEEDGAAQRRLALLRGLFERDKLDAEDTFDLAYLLGEAKETAEAVKVYETYTRENEAAAALYNLALGYIALGRDADALDALETARRTGYDADDLNTIQGTLRQRLLRLRERVLRNPQPYLQKAEWFQHYVNPFTLLNVEPGDVADNAKALQKAKQALLREIELEDGKLEWLPGLVIDKSAAMAKLTELDNEEARRAHQLVFENGALADFLMRGSLEHFLVREDGSSDATLPHLIDAAVLRRIGSSFAAQYDQVLSRAVEQEDLHAVECLLDGRRWVLPSQQDACSESTRRLLTRVREPLLKLASEREARPFTRAEVDQAFGHGSLGELLTHLPVEYYEAHSEVGGALRGLAVAFYNRELDAEGAKAILAMGRVCAQKSPALAHQLEADEKTLDGFIEEEKSKEARLSFSNKDLAITKAGVVYGNHKLAPADIIGVRWGLVQTSLHPPTARHSIAFQARRGPDIEVSWTTSSNLEEQAKFWSGLVDATFTFILGSVAEEFQKQLDSGELTKVGPVVVRKDGVVLTAKGWFSDKQVLVPWQQLSATLTNGSVVLRDTANAKATATLPLETTYNAIVLHIIANRKESASS